MGCNGGGGTTGIGLGARMRAEHGQGWARARTRARQQEPEAVEWLRHGCREPGHWREQSRGGLEERNE